MAAIGEGSDFPGDVRDVLFDLETVHITVGTTIDIQDFGVFEVDHLSHRIHSIFDQVTFPE